MCLGPKIKTKTSDLTMVAGNQVERAEFSPNSCTKLLELAAIDDLSAFRYEIEMMGSNLDQVGFWYGRSFNSRKMGFEERTPLMIASLYGSTSILKYIVNSGQVNINRACGSDGATALHCAAAGGSWSSLEAVKILINASGDVNAVDMKGKRAVDLVAPCVKASSSSKRKTLEILLSGVITSTSKLEEVEEGNSPKATNEGSEKKEYPIDISLPDINSGIYGTDEFRMYSFKVKPCSRAYSHDWTECPFVHPGENARRRDLTKYNYTCVPCPEFKKGSCAKGDNCEYAHGVFESWLHPAQYRTRLCKDETGCSRKVCFFAHKREELRPLYACTGSAMPSPKSVSTTCVDLTTLSPMSLGSSSITCSSPMGGGISWQSKTNFLTPPTPTLQLPGSRLKSGMSAREMDVDMEILGLEKVRIQQRLVEQMPSSPCTYSSSSSRLGGEIKATNLDMFGSYDTSLLSQLQSSPPGMQIRQNLNQLRMSYPSKISTSGAVAAAVLNSRSSSAFTKRSQSFIDRGRSSLSGGVPSKLSEWSSHDGRLEWGFNGEDLNMLRKSSSFGNRNGIGIGSMPTPPNLEEPDVSWVNSLVKEAEPHVHWLDQMYMEQEQMVA